MSDFQVVHFSPGRLRVRLAEVVNNVEFAGQLQQLLSSVEGIKSVTTSTVTGSVLVEYDPVSLDLQSLLTLGRMLNLVPENMPDPGASVSSPGLLAAGAERVGEALGSAIEQGGRVAGQALNPRFAIQAAAINAVALRAGMGMSPTAAAVWVLASVLVSPRSKPGSTENKS